MAVEHLSERMPDRSQQVLGLLNELSERLRKSENERDEIKRDIAAIRETLQDLDDKNSQTQRALLAFENKFDATETSVEILARRVTGMEGDLDKQSTELLAILRKIEERFESYDREYKNHASSITHFGDTLDRFDKKLEKLVQDKARMARKLDALEFQLVDTEERLQNARASAPLNNKDSRNSINVWSPESAQPQFMNGPAEIPQPRRRFTLTATPAMAKFGQYAAYGALGLVIIGLVYGAVTTFLQHPGTSPKTNTAQTTSAPLSLSTLVQKAPDQTSEKVTVPTRDFFSTTVRAQMDDQMVAARKLEDNATAELISVADTAALKQRLKRDTSLPNAVKAIEDKAGEGDAQAQHDMGALYTAGQSGVNVDYDRAVFWFRESAQNGVANARYNLGVLYQQGLGTEKDIDQALNWYRAASLLEHPEARYNLGIAYVEGIGVAYNPAMAAGYFEQAARGGVIEAAYNLGLILENGLIDEPRPFEAMFWYKLAADGGSTDGAKALARLQTEQSLDDNAWASLYSRMLSERPDLKRLADSRANAKAPAQPVRIHVPAPGEDTAPNAFSARKIDDAPKPLKQNAAARMTPPPAPAETILAAPQGNDGTDPQMVARIQTMLVDEGMFKGATDGRMGPMTTEAIRRYQTKYNMAVDGQPSTALMAQMLARRLAETAEPAAGNKAESKKNTIKVNE